MWGGPAVVWRRTPIIDNGESPSGVSVYPLFLWVYVVPQLALLGHGKRLHSLTTCSILRLSLLRIMQRPCAPSFVLTHTIAPLYAYTLIHLYMLTRIHLGVEFCLLTWHWCMHFCHLLPTIVPRSKALRQLCLHATYPRTSILIFRTDCSLQALVLKAFLGLRSAYNWFHSHGPVQWTRYLVG